jgi:hypothetical protein
MTIAKEKQNVSALNDYITSLIIKPSIKYYHFENPKKMHFSQNGEDVNVDGHFKQKRNGFFVETYARDGEVNSNTLYLEVYRSWSGLLIEHNPILFNKLLKKHRKCYAINACISDNNVPKVMKSYRNSKYEIVNQMVTIDHLKKSGDPLVFDSETTYTPCFSLNAILNALKVKQVDYFSIMIKEDEFNILNELLNNSKIFETLTIQYNGKYNDKSSLIKYLNDYTLINQNSQSIFLAKKVELT